MPPDPAVVRKVRDLVQPLKESRKTVLFLSPVLRLPPELEKETTLVDFSLSTLEEMAYVGGMTDLKMWLHKRRLAFTEQARHERSGW